MNRALFSMLFIFSALTVIIIIGCGGGGGGGETGLLPGVTSPPALTRVPVKVSLKFIDSEYRRANPSQAGVKASDLGLSRILMVFWQMTPVTGEVVAEQFDPTANPEACYGRKFRNGDYLMTFGGYADFNYTLHSGEVKVLSGSSYALFAIALDSQDQPKYCGLKGRIEVRPGIVTDTGTTTLYQGSGFATTQLAEAGIERGFNQDFVLGTSSRVALVQPVLSSLQAILPVTTLFPGESLDLSAVRIVGVYSDGGTVEIVNYFWSITSGGGELADSVYTAPDTAGTVTLTVTASPSGTAMSTGLTLSVLQPALPAGTWKLAYSSGSGTMAEILVSAADSMQTSQLTDNSLTELCPAFSPDGNRIVFQCDSATSQIFQVYIDGTGLIALTSGSGYYMGPVCSPDGSKIAYTGLDNGNYDIWIMNADGSGKVNLTNDPGYDSDPAFSADGDWIAFCSDRSGSRDIHLMHIDGTSLIRITDDPSDDGQPCCATDERITFVSNRDGNDEIYVMNIDGTNPTRLTRNAASDTEPSFSPDGSLIAFESNRTGRSDIFIMKSDGTSPVCFTESGSGGSTPAFGITGNPFLSSITLSPTSITLLPNGNLQLSQVAVTAHYSNGSTGPATGLTFGLTGPGALSGAVYTAPGSSATAEITVMSTVNGFIRSAALAVTVGHEPQVLTVSIPATQILTGAVLSLPGTGEVQYTSGLTAEASLTWFLSSGTGEVSGLVFTAPAVPGTAEITASYTEGGVTVTQNFVIIFTSQPAPYHGLTVNLTPAGAVAAGAQWSLDGGGTWRNSGATAEIQQGVSYSLAFKPVAEYYAPAAVTRIMGTADTTETAVYTAIPVYRVLTVNIAPEPVISLGAQWSSDYGTIWRLSGDTVEFPEGAAYMVIFSPVSGYGTPETIVGTIGVTDEIRTGTYTANSHVLTVNITPAGAITAGGQWSVDAGMTWLESGSTVEVQQGATYELTFGPAAGYTPPSPVSGVMGTVDTTETAVYTAIPVYRVLTVNIAPEPVLSLGAQWSVDSGSSWYSSGDTLELAEGASYEITFAPVSGYTSPAAITGTIDMTDEIRTGTYTAISHILTVNLAPAGAVYGGAQANLDGGPVWYDSGSTFEVQEGATYTVECKVLANWAKPSPVYGIMPASDSVETVYYQPVYGASWTQSTGNAAWSARHGHTSLFFDNKIWVIGECGGGNDVWYSADGINWNQATAAAAWPTRYGHTSVVFDNKMWVLGGIDGAVKKNDVWYSIDGINWVQATGNAAWTARYGHTGVVFDNKIWVIGECGGGNDVWYSADGINWNQATAAAAWPTRYGHTSVVF
ncbi:MAG: DUF5050 domain-containing protein, partial [Candidatus Wallbacteria bacterium]|nr:DUF5050 domain-containing protein [Candidatus Wallbacteria bacterium]